ncbi:DUF6228 family protein [Streptomyces lasiicapitis]|uniref:DUF6228 family protein n=1 Tax=Streptomyces lasiicapitis TaxID=1923961 RepID=UPI0036ABA358
MTSPDNGIDAEHSVTVCCQENSSVSVKFGDWLSIDEDSTHYTVELRAPGLTARTNEIVAWTGENDLALFLEALASNYQGWDGERTWETNDKDLSVSATFRSGGYIGLTWTLRPWPRAAGCWTASVTTWLEAGEQMASVGADARRFFGAERP